MAVLYFELFSTSCECVIYSTQYYVNLLHHPRMDLQRIHRCMDDLSANIIVLYSTCVAIHAVSHSFAARQTSPTITVVELLYIQDAVCPKIQLSINQQSVIITFILNLLSISIVDMLNLLYIHKSPVVITINDYIDRPFINRLSIQ